MHTVVPEVSHVSGSISEGHGPVLLLAMVELTIEGGAIFVVFLPFTRDLSILEDAFTMCAIIEEILTLSVGHVIRELSFIVLSCVVYHPATSIGMVTHPVTFIKVAVPEHLSAHALSLSGLLVTTTQEVLVVSSRRHLFLPLLRDETRHGSQALEPTLNLWIAHAEEGAIIPRVDASLVLLTCTAR